jgi:hypothetical protein
MVLTPFAWDLFGGIPKRIQGQIKFTKKNGRNRETIEATYSRYVDRTPVQVQEYEDGCLRSTFIMRKTFLQ